MLKEIGTKIEHFVIKGPSALLKLFLIFLSFLDSWLNWIYKYKAVDSLACDSFIQCLSEFHLQILGGARFDKL